ncbi:MULTISPECIES: hypothetical protein [unclassified Nostoc]|uniref:hypothetical protein n=1 Tax=unclassified Nostoc TaxID=2593658 RepID=UPI0025AAF68C|nr:MULTISPECIES: hypothetical protein [unclassified Nostoc]MDM9585305.1 hypothetical protein [Nostoc sp. GT001]MDZ7945300.1 hypothetical protein [Nostoc sp. EfeVER01]MDZ7993489.1 hypothetical protein [Nostoc sp. EspVER01]
MPNIKISELYPLGSDLFQDSESFLNDMTNDEIQSLTGGRKRGGLVVNVGSVNININTAFSAIANTINANSIGNANSAVG